MAKITYLKEGEDNKSQLIIDSVQVDSSNYGIDSKIHAIQWNGSKGEIEYNDGTPNKEITDISSLDLETKHATEKKANSDAAAKVVSDAEAKYTYVEKRVLAYPTMKNQIDDIYHNGIEGWRKTIKAVKDKYPK